MCRPGTLVGIARKGPPVVVFGFGSQLSSWLSPPWSQNVRTRFCLGRNCSAAAAGIQEAPVPNTELTPAAAAKPAAAPPKNERRETT